MTRSATIHRLDYKGESAGANASAHLQRIKESGNGAEAQSQVNRTQG